MSSPPPPPPLPPHGPPPPHKSRGGKGGKDKAACKFREFCKKYACKYSHPSKGKRGAIPRLADGTTAAVGMYVVALADSRRSHYSTGSTGRIMELKGSGKGKGKANASDPVVLWDHSGDAHQASSYKLKLSSSTDICIQADSSDVNAKLKDGTIARATIGDVSSVKDGLRSSLKKLKESRNPRLTGASAYGEFCTALASVQRTMNQTYNQRYQRKKGEFSEVSVHGLPEEFSVWRCNHNGTHGARKVQFSRVILEAVAKKGKDRYKSAANSILGDPDTYARFMLGVHLSRSGRLDEQPSSRDPWGLMRSGIIWQKYMEELGLAPTTAGAGAPGEAAESCDVYQALFIYGDAHIDSDNYICKLMKKVMSIAHDIDYRRLEDQRDNCEDPALVLKRMVDTYKSEGELGREMETKLAFPAFQLSGYRVEEPPDSPADESDPVGKVLEPFYRVAKGKGKGGGVVSKGKKGGRGRKVHEKMYFAAQGFQNFFDDILQVGQKVGEEFYRVL